MSVSRTMHFGGKPVQQHRILRASVLILGLLLGACASAGGPAEKGSEGSPPVITEQEIRSSNLPNAYELVSRLRRAWLRRDPSTGNEVRVFIEEREVGGASVFRDIPAVEVRELRYFDGDAAAARWGQQAASSVIEVIRS